MAGQAGGGGAEQQVLHAGGDGVAVLGPPHRIRVVGGADEHHDRSPQVLALGLLLAVGRCADAPLVGGHELAEAPAPVALHHGEAPREGLLVVRRPHRQAQQAVDELGRHLATGIDAQAGAAAHDEPLDAAEVGQVLHRPHAIGGRRPWASARSGDGQLRLEPPGQLEVEGVGRHRLAEQEALGVVAPEPAQVLELQRRLEALGHHREPERVPEADEGVDDGGVAGLDARGRPRTSGRSSAPPPGSAAGR